MSGLQTSDTMPKLGHVTDLREQWLVRTDGVLAHRLQDREISSHLCENRYRNQQIREDFPVALNEQMDIERELRQKEVARLRQADMDAEIAREMAEINLRRQRRQYSADILQQPGCSRGPPPAQKREFTTPSQSHIPDDIDPDALGLTPAELEEMKRRLEQEERDAKLARQLSHESDDRDALLSDMRFAVEAQDGELAKLLQEREYKKLQRAKEKARQKALLKKQQRRAAQQLSHLPMSSTNESQAALLDAYSNPRDLIKQNGLQFSRSVDSDLNYVEPFEKEHIQSKASAIQSKEISKQWYMQQMDGSQSSSQNASMSCRDISNMNVHSFNITDEMKNMPSSQSIAAMQHRQPPPVPVSIKKPRFPDPVSIRPASHYPADESISSYEFPPTINNYSENNNLYSSTYPSDHSNTVVQEHNVVDGSKRLSVISDITPENLSKKKKKQADLIKKKKGCKIQ